MKRSTAVLGLSSYFHDSSAALVCDGEVISAAAEERFTRIKHDANFPLFAAKFCLEELGKPASELDAVMFYEEPHSKFVRILSTLLERFPKSRKAFVEAMKQWLGEKLWMKSRISKELDVDPDKIRFVPHHLSHAAHAFYTSPFDSAAILTIDAVGEWACTSQLLGDRAAMPQLRELSVKRYPHSIGLVYSALTGFLGFRPNCDECSTMALAAFGQPTLTEQMRKIIRVLPEAEYEIDPKYFNFLGTEVDTFEQSLLELLGPARTLHDRLTFDALLETSVSVGGEQQKYADLACSMQSHLETVMLHLAERLRQATRSDKLCLAGGVANNVVAIRKIVDSGIFSSVHVPIDPGDGGAAIGAALFGYHKLETDVRKIPLNPYLGKEYDEEEDVAMLKHADVSEWRDFVSSPEWTDKVGGIKCVQYENLQTLTERVADFLNAGLIVGWFQGRFEFGPRALGNRSLLVDPSNLDAVLRLRTTVKKREAFRPFGVSFTESAALKALEIRHPFPLPSLNMQMTVNVRSDYLDRIRGGIHVDNSTRPHICDKCTNPQLHKLLEVFGEKTGLEALLNTSFNESGYPIVASPSEAMLSFVRTGIDVLVLNGTICSKSVDL